MKKNYVRMLLVVVLCTTIGNVQAQGVKGLLNKAKEGVNGIATKEGGGKDATKSQHATAKSLAPEVKNSVSEIRALTGLTKADFEKKVKSMGYVETTDNTGLLGGGTVYKSKSKGYSLAVQMGTRGNDLYTREVTKYIYTKKADLSAMKVTLLNLGKQCTDLKAEFKYANVEERGKMFSGTGAKNTSTRTSKFLPALDNMINAKKEFFVTDEYTEQDYEYRINFFYIKADTSAMIQLTVVDNTVDSQEG